MAGGYILLSRKTLDSEVWGWDSEHLRLWIYLLLNVHSREEPVTVHGIQVHRGQLLRSYRLIAEDCEHISNNRRVRWSTSRVHRMLARFERAGSMQQRGTELGTLITVQNFARFQDFDAYRSGLGTGLGRGLGTGLEQAWNNNNTEESEDQQKDVAVSEEKTVFDYWQRRRAEAIGKTSGPAMKPTAKRLSKIRARLREGYTPEQLMAAVDVVLTSDYHLQRGFTDIELICRDQEHVEQYLAKARASTPADDFVQRELARRDELDRAGGVLIDA